MLAALFNKKSVWLTVLCVFAATILVYTITARSAAAATTTNYELEKIYLYDYHDTDDTVVISGSKIDSSMSQVVDWSTVRIRASVTNGYYDIEGANLDGKYYVVSLPNEYADLTIKILDKDGNLQKHYYLQLRRKAQGIESVIFSGNNFNYTFDSLVSNNVLTVPSWVDVLTMEVKQSSNDYIVQYNTKLSDNNTWDIDLPEAKPMPVYITVAPKDKPNNYTQYKIEIKRLSDEATAQGALSALKVTSGTDSYEMFPAFDPDVYNYYVMLPNNARSVSITPTLGNTGASISMDGVIVPSGKPSGNYTTSTSGNQVMVMVTDLNNQINVYTINLLRTTRSDGSDPALTNLRIKQGNSKNESSMMMQDTIPVFNRDVYEYELVMDSAYSFFSFRPSYVDSNCAAFLVVDKKMIPLSESGYSDPVQLSMDDKIFIRVFSADFKHYQDYNIETSARILDDNYLLDNLVLKVDNLPAKLSTGFSRTNYEYKASGDDDSKYYTITATASSKESTISVNNKTLVSGVESEQFIMGDSVTPIEVIVTAENGDTAKYKITLDRKGLVAGKVVLRIGKTSYVVNGVSKPLTAAPYISGGRTLVPVRVIAEALGASVNYNSEHKQITIKKDDERFYMEVGKNIEGFDSTPEIVNGTTFVPIRYVSEKLKCKCVFNSASKEVIISYALES